VNDPPDATTDTFCTSLTAPPNSVVCAFVQLGEMPILLVAGLIAAVLVPLEYDKSLTILKQGDIGALFVPQVIAPLIESNVIVQT
jgi:hypothetical protein